MLDRSGSILRNSAINYSPDKTSLRLKQMERELSMYRQTITSKNQEIQYLTDKNSQLMRNTSPRHSNDQLYENSLQEQIDRLTLRLTEKSKEYEKLYQKYSSLENQMATLQDYASDLERERKFLADKLADIQIHAEGDQMIGELQNKMVLMSTEIMRLGHLSRTKTQEVNQLKFRINEFNEEKEIADKSLMEKDRVIMQYRQRIRGLEKRVQELQSNRQYDNQSTYKTLTIQIDRLSSQLRTRNDEISTLEHKIQVLENERSSNKNSRFVQKNLMDLEFEIERLTKTNTTYKDEIFDLQNSLKQQKRQNGRLTDENERYQRLSKKIESQLEELKQVRIKQQNEKISIEVETHLRTIRQQKTIIDDLRREDEAREASLKKKFQQELQYLKTMLSQSEQKCKTLHRDVYNYEDKVALLSQEVERLTIKNNQYQEENAELKRMRYKIESKQRQIKEVERIKQSAEAASRRDKQEIDRLKSDLQELWNKNNELQAKQYQFRSVKDQLEIITERLQAKTQQNKHLEQKLSEQAYWQSNNQRVSELEAQLNQERTSWRTRTDETTVRHEEQIKNYTNTINQLETKLTQVTSDQSTAENNYMVLAEQIRRLNQVLSESSDIILNQKRDIKLLEANLQAAENSLHSVKSQYISSQKVQQEIQKHTEVYKKELTMIKEDHMKVKNKLQELLGDNSHTQQENGQLRMNLQEARQRLKEKQQELKDLMSDVRAAKKSEDSLLNIISEIKSSNTRLEQKMAEIEQDYIHRLEDKTREKQTADNQVLQLTRRLRQAQSSENQYKYEAMALKNKAELLAARQIELEEEIRNRQNKLRELDQEKKASAKKSQEDLFEKLNEYETEIRKNARQIGELDGELRNKSQSLKRAQDRLKQVENERSRFREQSVQREEGYRREYDRRITQINQTITLKQQEVAHLKKQLKIIEQTAKSNHLNLQSQAQSIKNRYEEKVCLLSQELERLNTVLYQKNEELQNLKGDLKKNSSEANHSMKHNKQTMDVLTLEITRLNGVLCNNIQQIRQLEQQLDKKHRELTRTANLTRKNEESMKDRIFQLEQDIEKVTSQNHKIAANAGVLSRKVQDLQKFESDNEKLRATISEINLQKNRIIMQNTELQSENSRIKMRYQEIHQSQSMHSKTAIKLSQLQETKRTYERKIALIASENEQLTGQIQTLKLQIQKGDDENNRMNREIVRLNGENINMTREKQKFRLTNEEIMNKLHHIKGEVNNQEISSFQKRIRHLENVNRQYENKIAMMAQQIQRLTLSKNSYSHSPTNQSHSQINVAFSAGGGQLKQKFDILESIHVKTKRQYDLMKDRLTEYEFKMKKLKGEFELINKLTHEYKDQNDYLRQQNHAHCIFIGTTLQNHAISQPSDLHVDESRKRSYTEDMLVKQTLNSQIDRLGVLNNSLRREIEDLRMQITESQSLRARMEENMAIFVIMAAELEALRNRGH